MDVVYAQATPMSIGVFEATLSTLSKEPELTETQVGQVDGITTLW